jgi:hypothetical protein
MKFLLRGRVANEEVPFVDVGGDRDVEEPDQHFI